jgi:hypothetical protein
MTGQLAKAIEKTGGNPTVAINVPACGK